LASADGEAGLVIHWGDGRVDTHCVAFSGDSISGDALLERAGYDINQFSGLVCAIDNVGCQHSGSFDSCTCGCQGGGDDCTYWGFFQQPYGAGWHYSALGAFSARSDDGDLQGWKWGEGGPASAPAPPATTFEAVCGHPPGAVSTVPPAATTQLTTAAPSATVASKTVEPASTTPPGGGATESTVDSAATNTAAPTVDAASATIPMNTPDAPAAGDGESASSSSASVVAFAVVAIVLVSATAAALLWRSRRGA
jgi:hypothetical protein